MGERGMSETKGKGKKGGEGACRARVKGGREDSKKKKKRVEGGNEGEEEVYRGERQHKALRIFPTRPHTHCLITQ